MWMNYIWNLNQSAATAAVPSAFSIQTLRVRGAWLFQLLHVLDDNVVQRRIPVSHLAHHQPQAEEFLFVQLLHGSPVVLDVRIFGHLRDDFGARNEIARDLIEERRRLGFDGLDFGQRVFLDGHAKVVAVFNLRDHKGDPHLEQIRVLHQFADDWLHDFNQIANRFVAMDNAAGQ